MAQKVAQYPTMSVVALAATVVLAYSVWGAYILSSERNAAYSANNPQVQLARN